MLHDLKTVTDNTPIIMAGSVITRVEDSDDAVISVFLDSYAGRSIHTARAYATECRRFLLWLRVRNRSPSGALLPVASVQDANAYISFLSSPTPFPERFLAANGLEGQPFRKPLGRASVNRAIVILHKLFDALRNFRASHGGAYCQFNPFALAHAGATGGGMDEGMDAERAFTETEMAAIFSSIEGLPKTTPKDLLHYHRARWIIHLLYRTFLRRDEAANLAMGDFEMSNDGWDIRVVGKGGKKRRIVATERLMRELRVYRLANGLPQLPQAGETTPVVFSVYGPKAGNMTAQAVYLVCKEIFRRAAEITREADPVSGKRLLSATPHWLRHTGITHAMESGVNPRYVQAQARHSSLNITARYDHQQAKAWRADFEKGGVI